MARRAAEHLDDRHRLVLTVGRRHAEAQSHFRGRESVLSINGDVRTTMPGADYAKDRMVTGVSLAHSRGLGSYRGEHSGRAASAMGAALLRRRPHDVCERHDKTYLTRRRRGGDGGSGGSVTGGGVRSA